MLAGTGGTLRRPDPPPRGRWVLTGPAVTQPLQRRSQPHVTIPAGRGCGPSESVRHSSYRWADSPIRTIEVVMRVFLLSVAIVWTAQSAFGQPADVGGK